MPQPAHRRAADPAGPEALAEAEHRPQRPEDVRRPEGRRPGDRRGRTSPSSRRCRRRSRPKGRCCKLIAPHVGGVKASDGTWFDADEKLEGGPSVLFDAVVLLPSQAEVANLATKPRAARLRRRRRRAPEVHRLQRSRVAAVHQGRRSGTPRRGVHRADEARRLPDLRRALPQTPLLGPRRRGSVSRSSRETPLDVVGTILGQGRGCVPIFAR